MKKTLALLLSALMLISAAAIAVSAEEPALATATLTAAATDTAITTAKAAYGTPTIDGKVDDIWKNAEVNTYGADSKVATAPACGQFRVMWDETYIYLLFEIKDSTMMDEATGRTKTGGDNWYNRDQVAVCFNPTNDYTATTGVGKTTSHFWYCYRPYGIVTNYVNRVGATFFSEDERVAANNSFNSLDFETYPMNVRMYAYDITSDGYVIEAKVNITAAYADWKNEAGKTIAFDTFVYGNDYTAEDTAAAQDHIYPWADTTITSYKDNSKKGQILLVEKAEEPAPATGDNTVLYAVVAVVAVMGTAVIVKKKVTD